MSIFSIKAGSQNPAVRMLEAMPAPARKFNFDVEFILDPSMEVGLQKFHFFVKNIDKPQYDFEFIEINQYGFRHKILTGITTGDLQIEFLDDSTNRVLAFIQHYLNGMTASERYVRTGTLPIMNRHGFNTAGVSPRGAVGSSLIKQIKIHQYSGIGTDGTGRGRIRTWVFEEPQIVNFDLDKQETEDEGVSGFVIRFNYKNVVIELDQNLYPDRPDEILDSLIDFAAPFTDGDARLPLAVFSLLKFENPFSTGILGTSGALGGVFGKILSTGGGVFNKVTDALSPQDLLGPIQQGRNDFLKSLPSFPDLGSITKLIPDTDIQGDLLSKLPDLPDISDIF